MIKGHSIYVFGTISPATGISTRKPWLRAGLTINFCHTHHQQKTFIPIYKRKNCNFCVLTHDRQ